MTYSRLNVLALPTMTIKTNLNADISDLGQGHRGWFYESPSQHPLIIQLHASVSPETRTWNKEEGWVGATRESQGQWGCFHYPLLSSDSTCHSCLAGWLTLSPPRVLCGIKVRCMYMRRLIRTTSFQWEGPHLIQPFGFLVAGQRASAQLHFV